jgi:hypothetical protein
LGAAFLYLNSMLIALRWYQHVNTFPWLAPPKDSGSGFPPNLDGRTPMIFVYTSLLLVLAVTQLVLKRRVASLEKKYVKVAKEAETVLRQNGYRDGNSNRSDPYLNAKRQLQLGLLAQKKERVETRYTAWQARADRFAALTSRVRGWKGKTLPYTFGVIDVATTLAVLDHLGLGDRINPHLLVETVKTLFTR